MNHLEQLVAEWYEYQGFFVRRNVRVGKLGRGGYEGELDVVAFNPQKRKLVHVECSLDTDSWAARKARFAKKFDVGRRYIPQVFEGVDLPPIIEQRAIFGYSSRLHTHDFEGAEIVPLPDFLREILEGLKGTWWSGVVPENLPLIRTLQIVKEYQSDLFTRTST